MLDFVAADPENLGEDEQQHPEQHQRPGQRPHVAEDRAEVDPLELGDGDQEQQVEESPPPAAKRVGPESVATRDFALPRSLALHRHLPLVLELDDALPMLAAEDDEFDRVVDVQKDARGLGLIDPQWTW